MIATSSANCRAGVLAADVLACPQAQTDSGMIWPISDADFNELCRTVLDAFTKALRSLGDTPARDLLQSDFNYAVFLIQYIHAQWVRHVSEANGITVRLGPLSKAFYEPDWATLARVYDRTTTVRQRLSALARDALRDIFLNERVTDKLAASFRLAPTWCVGSRSALRAEYLRRTRQACRFVDISLLLAASSARTTESMPHEVRATVDDLIGHLNKFFKRKAGYELDTEIMSRVWHQRLSSLKRHQACVASLRPPQTLLLTNVARPLHRLVALTLRRGGTHVIGFHHGNDVRNIWSPSSAINEYAHASEFLCPTEAMARFHHVDFERTGAAAISPVKFVGLESSRYADMAAKAKAKPAPAVIRSAMVIGFPFNANRYLLSAADFHAFQVDVERRLAAAATAAGVHPIYKAHPERLIEARAAVGNVFTDFRSEPFETIWSEADAFIFGCTTSTTFGFALLTPRPVIVLDIEGQDWNREAYDLLKHRCRLVPAWFGAGNRLEFDLNALHLALTTPIEALDMRYVEAFMQPRPELGAARHQEGPSR